MIITTIYFGNDFELQHLLLKFKKNKIMNTDKNPKSKNSEVKKENQDFPNVPASSEKIQNEDTLKKQVKETSKLNPDGKTDNIDKQSEN